MKGGSGVLWRVRQANNGILSNIFLYFLDYFLIFTLSQISGHIYICPGRPGPGLEIGIVPGKSGHLAAVFHRDPEF